MCINSVLFVCAILFYLKRIDEFTINTVALAQLMRLYKKIKRRKLNWTAQKKQKRPKNTLVLVTVLATPIFQRGITWGAHHFCIFFFWSTLIKQFALFALISFCIYNYLLDHRRRKKCLKLMDNLKKKNYG